MLNSKLKLSVALCSILLLVSCGGGGSDDSSSSSNTTSVPTGSTPNTKVVTSDNVDIDDAKIVTESIESIISTQAMGNGDSPISNNSSKYRYTSSVSYNCTDGGVVDMSITTDEAYKINVTSNYKSCSSKYFTMNGSINSITDSSDQNNITIKQTYLTDFTMSSTLYGTNTIYSNSYMDISMDSNAIFDKGITAIYNTHTSNGKNETLTKNLTISTIYHNQYNEVYLCINKGAIYSSVATSANPFVIDETFDPSCDKKFIIDITTNNIKTGSLQYYIGSKIFRTYAFAGKLETCSVSNGECPQ